MEEYCFCFGMNLDATALAMMLQRPKTRGFKEAEQAPIEKEV
jgi:hypothetical protein